MHETLACAAGSFALYEKGAVSFIFSWQWREIDTMLDAWQSRSASHMGAPFMSQPRTPGSIIGASVIMFIYGALLVMCGACAGAMSLFQPQDDPMGINAALNQEAPGHWVVSVVSSVANILFGFLFIVSGIGVLRLSAFFRITAFLACAGILLTTIAGAVYTALVVLPVQQRVMLREMQNPNNPPLPFDVNMLLNASMAFGLLISIGIPVLFCLPTAILLSMKSARDAFAGILPQGDDDPYLVRRRPPRDDHDDDDDYNSSNARRSPDDTGITDRGQ